MNLEFKLLIIDDNPDGVVQATRALDDYLKESGFSLDRNNIENPDVHLQGQQDVARGIKYDLAMVDYNLGNEEYTGADMAQKLRKEMPYTDMIFYSARPEIDLLKELADRQVAGVFVATRDELDDALKGVADTIIGKAVDITHMRGIAMANTADMEVRMDNALERIFSLQEFGEKLVGVANRTFEKMEESNTQVQTRFDEYKNDSDISKLIGDRMFTFHDKYRVIMRLVNVLSKESQNHKSAEIDVFKRFGKEVIEKRNILAHVREDVDDNGKTIFKSAKEGNQIAIDDDWMKNYRQHLGKHKNALDAICTTIEEEFAS